MVDTTKTIKNSSDKELDALLIRLRKESEAQSIISDLKRKASSGYIPYDYCQEISTEKPIESLYHYGILGMRWGKRSTVSTSSNDGKSSNASEDHNKKLALKKKSIREMTNAELKTANERLQLEKQYKELNKQDVSAGKKFMTKILGEIGSEVLKSVVKSAITGEINKNNYAKSVKNAKSVTEKLLKTMGQNPLDKLNGFV